MLLAFVFEPSNAADPVTRGERLVMVVLMQEHRRRRHWLGERGLRGGRVHNLVLPLGLHVLDGLHPLRLGLEDGTGQRPPAAQRLHLIEQGLDAGVLALQGVNSIEFQQSTGH